MFLAGAHPTVAAAEPRAAGAPGLLGGLQWAAECRPHVCQHRNGATGEFMLSVLPAFELCDRKFCANFEPIPAVRPFCMIFVRSVFAVFLGCRFCCVCTSVCFLAVSSSCGADWSTLNDLSPSTPSHIAIAAATAAAGHQQQQQPCHDQPANQ